MAKTYTTSQGDTWDAVAYKLWGRECLLRHLLAANPEHLDVLVFPAGVILTVPDIVIPPQSFGLPPWMQS